MGGGVTRIIAAVGVRGFATTVQYDLGNNGANGLYSANMPSSGCPSFTSIASNANGFVYGTAVTGSPYTTGAAMNAGSGTPYSNPTTGDQLGRIDIAVAPSNPNVIYAQVQSIAAEQPAAAAAARRLPARRLADEQRRHHLDVHGGLAGPRNAATTTPRGLATTRRTGTTRASRSIRTTPTGSSSTRMTSGSRPAPGSTLTDLTCGYNGTSGHVVHVDQHALAFVPGSSSILLIGSDGGAFSTSNADIAGDGDADVREHGHRPEHDRVLLGRHQRLLRDLGEPVGGRRRPGQRAERRGLQRLPDRPCAVADDGRRRRVLRPHRPGRNGLEPALLRRQQQRRHVALRRELPRRRDAATERHRAAGAATRSRSLSPSTSSTAECREATTALRQARRAGAATSSTGRPASGSRSRAATPA